MGGLDPHGPARHPALAVQDARLARRSAQFISEKTSNEFSAVVELASSVYIIYNNMVVVGW